MVSVFVITIITPQDTLVSLIKKGIINLISLDSATFAQFLDARYAFNMIVFHALIVRLYYREESAFALNKE